MKKFSPHIFQCKHCKQITKSIIAPGSLKCAVGFYHSWNDLGIEGNISYKCGKCETIVNLAKYPLSIDCPTGGEHMWQILK